MRVIGKSEINVVMGNTLTGGFVVVIVIEDIEKALSCVEGAL